MKKFALYLILPVFLILMAAPGITAQNDNGPDDLTKNTAIGIRFGGMISDLWFPGRTNKPVELDVPIEPLKSLTIGISVVKDYSPRFFVYADIMYERKGRGIIPAEAPQTLPMPIATDNKPTAFYPIGLQYVSASTFFMFCTNKKPKLSIGSGIYNAVLIRHYNATTNGHGPSPQKNYTSFGLQSFDVGLGVKAGIRHPIKDNLIAELNITATSGLRPVFFKFYKSIIVVR
jgi:hypothetical protein